MASLEPRCIGTADRTVTPAYVLTAGSSGSTWYPSSFLEGFQIAHRAFEIFWFVNSAEGLVGQHIIDIKDSGNSTVLMKMWFSAETATTVTLSWQWRHGGGSITSISVNLVKSSLAGHWWHSIAQIEDPGVPSGDTPGQEGDGLWHVYHGRVGVTTSNTPGPADTMPYFFTGTSPTGSTGGLYNNPRRFAGFRYLNFSAVPYRIAFGTQTNATGTSSIAATRLNGGFAEMRFWTNWYSDSPLPGSPPTPSEWERRRNIYVRDAAVTDSPSEGSEVVSGLYHCMRFNEIVTNANQFDHAGNRATDFDGTTRVVSGSGFFTSPIQEPVAGVVVSLTNQLKNVVSRSSEPRSGPLVGVRGLTATDDAITQEGDEDAILVRQHPMEGTASDSVSDEGDDPVAVAIRFFEPPASEALATDEILLGVDYDLAATDLEVNDGSTQNQPTMLPTRFLEGTASDSVSDDVDPFLGVTVQMSATGAGNDSASSNAQDPVELGATKSLYTILVLPDATATEAATMSILNDAYAGTSDSSTAEGSGYEAVLQGQDPAVAYRFDEIRTVVSEIPATPTGLIVSVDQILALPVSGAAYNNVVTYATQALGDINPYDQNSTDDQRVLARVLVGVRTANATMIAAAKSALLNLGTTENQGVTAEVLGLCRNIGAYVVAADILDQAGELTGGERATLAAYFTAKLGDPAPGPRNLIETHEQRPNNFGTHAGFARMAIDLFTGDFTDFLDAVEIAKRWFGDSTSSFNYTESNYGTDTSWQAEAYPLFFGINRQGTTLTTGAGVITADGGLPEELRRPGVTAAALTTWPDDLSPRTLTYCWEAMQGATMQCWLLDQAGYDAFNWSNQALRRAFDFIWVELGDPNLDIEPTTSDDDTWITWIVNRYYGTTYTTVEAKQPGKNFGFTDWLLGTPYTPPSAGTETTYVIDDVTPGVKNDALVIESPTTFTRPVIVSSTMPHDSGNMISFTQADQSVIVDNLNIGNPEPGTTDFTVVVAFDRSGFAGLNSADIVRKPSDDAGESMWRIHLNFLGQPVFTRRTNASGNVSVTSSVIPNPNDPHLIVATYSNAFGMRLYVDGVLRGTNSVTTANQSSSSEPVTFDNALAGFHRIDDFAFIQDAVDTTFPVELHRTWLLRNPEQEIARDFRNTVAPSDAASTQNLPTLFKTGQVPLANEALQSVSVSTSDAAELNRAATLSNENTPSLVVSSELDLVAVRLVGGVLTDDAVTTDETTLSTTDTLVGEASDSTTSDVPGELSRVADLRNTASTTLATDQAELSLGKSFANGDVVVATLATETAAMSITKSFAKDSDAVSSSTFPTLTVEGDKVFENNVLPSLSVSSIVAPSLTRTADLRNTDAPLVTLADELALVVGRTRPLEPTASEALATEDDPTLLRTAPLEAFATLQPTVSTSPDTGVAVTRTLGANDQLVNSASTNNRPQLEVAGEKLLTNDLTPSLTVSDEATTLSTTKDLRNDDTPSLTTSDDDAAMSVTYALSDTDDAVSSNSLPTLVTAGEKVLENSGTPSLSVTTNGDVFLLGTKDLRNTDDLTTSEVPGDLLVTVDLRNTNTPSESTSAVVAGELSRVADLRNNDTPSLTVSDDLDVGTAVALVLVSDGAGNDAASSSGLPVLIKGGEVPLDSQPQLSASSEAFPEIVLTLGLVGDDPVGVASYENAPQLTAVLSFSNPGTESSSGDGLVDATIFSRVPMTAAFNLDNNTVSSEDAPILAVEKEFIPPADLTTSSDPVVDMRLAPAFTVTPSLSTSDDLEVPMGRTRPFAATDGSGDAGAGSASGTASIIRDRDLRVQFDDSSSDEVDPGITAGTIEIEIPEVETITAPLCTLEAYLSKLDIWNTALTKLGLETLTATTDTTSEAIALAANWDLFKAKFLRDHSWNGGFTSVELSRYQNTVTPGDVNPTGPWSYAYRLDNLTPSWVRSMRLNGKENRPGPKGVGGVGLWEEKTIFNDAGTGVFCLCTNETSATLDYIFLVADNDLEAFLPADMRWAMALSLAEHMASDLGSSNADIRVLAEQAEIARREARRTDGQSGSTPTHLDLSIHDSFF